MLLQDGLRGALNQSALEPAGPQAAKVTHLWWFAFTIAVVVYVLTRPRTFRILETAFRPMTEPSWG